MQAHHYKISLYYFSLHCSTWDMYMYDRCIGVERATYPMLHSEDLEVAKRSLIFVRLHTEAL